MKSTRRMMKQSKTVEFHNKNMVERETNKNRIFLTSVSRPKYLGNNSI
jgi:hypothetical protein